MIKTIYGKSTGLQDAIDEAEDKVKQLSKDNPYATYSYYSVQTIKDGMNWVHLITLTEIMPTTYL